MKSNIRAKLANSGSGSRKKFFSKLNQQKIRKKAGHKVRDENIVDDDEYDVGDSGQPLILKDILLMLMLMLMTAGVSGQPGKEGD